MRGDLTILCAYGAPLAVTVVYRDSDGDPIDVTGYAGELRLSTFNGGGEFYGTPHGDTVLTVACTVGTTNGQFACTVSIPQTLALAATFGDPIPTRQGRWSLWVTPPASTAFPIAHGWVDYRQLGEAVADVEQDVYDTNVNASVSAFGARGVQGPTGVQGPPGTGVEPTDGKTTLATTTTTTIGTIDLSDYLNKFWVAEVETTARRTTDGKVNIFRQTIQGFTASDGTTTHEDPVNQTNPQTPSLGRPIFENTASGLLRRFKASTSASTTLSARVVISQTWDP